MQCLSSFWVGYSICKVKLFAWPEESLCVYCQGGAGDSCSPSKGESGAQGGTKADVGQWPHRTEVCSPMAPEQEQELKAGDANLVKPPSQWSSDKSIAIRHAEVKLESKVTGQGSSVRYIHGQARAWLGCSWSLPLSLCLIYLAALRANKGAPDQFLHTFSQECDSRWHSHALSPYSQTPRVGGKRSHLGPSHLNSFSLTL